MEAPHIIKTYKILIGICPMDLSLLAMENKGYPKNNAIQIARKSRFRLIFLSTLILGIITYLKNMCKIEKYMPKRLTYQWHILSLNPTN